jgi:hypothetical protein
MRDWRASPCLEVPAHRVHELNILSQAAADLARGRPPSTGLLARIGSPLIGWSAVCVVQ